MRHLLTILTMALSIGAAAQNYQAVSLAKKELKLNNGSKYDGTNSMVLTLEIPALTSYIYYSIDASPNGGPQGLDLYSQVAQLAGQSQNFTELTGGKIVPQLSIPQGDGSVNVYLVLDEDDVTRFTNRKKGWHYNKNYSRENLGGATIGVPVGAAAGAKTTYLCLRNPSMTTAQFVNVEVVAVTQKAR